MTPRLACGPAKKIVMRKFLSDFVEDRSGVTSIEYGMIASLIAVFIVGAITRIGTTELAVTFAKVNAAFLG